MDCLCTESSRFFHFGPEQRDSNCHVPQAKCWFHLLIAKCCFYRFESYLDWLKTRQCLKQEDARESRSQSSRPVLQKGSACTPTLRVPFHSMVLRSPVTQTDHRSCRPKTVTLWARPGGVGLPSQFFRKLRQENKKRFNTCLTAEEFKSSQGNLSQNKAVMQRPQQQFWWLWERG